MCLRATALRDGGANHHQGQDHLSGKGYRMKVTRNLGKLGALAVVACAVATATPAVAAPPPPSEPGSAQPPAEKRPAGQKGVDRAKAAGIKVDPGAEEAMKQAPADSCYGDPTQAKCPPAKRIAAPVQSEFYGEAAPPAENETANASATKTKAKAAQAPQCAVRANAPYFAAGLAQGFGANQCYATVTRHELYVSLYDYISTGRRLLDSRSAAGTGASTIRAEPRFNCNHAASARQYEVYATGYALLRGV